MFGQIPKTTHIMRWLESERNMVKRAHDKKAELVRVTTVPATYVMGLDSGLLDVPYLPVYRGGSYVYN